MPVIYEPKGRALEYSLLAINHWKGCTHGCFYCYAKKMAVQYGQDFENVTPKKDIIAQLIKEAPKYAGTNKRVLLSFMSDPYPEIEKKERLTHAVIQILNQHKIPFQVLTKAGTRAVDDFELYGPNDAFATTLTYLQDDGKALEAEPGAALPSNRIEAIRQAHARGIETWVSLEPVLGPDESLAIIKETHEIVDLYKIGKLNHVSNGTNWRAFGIEAVEMCQKFGKRYYVKDDLAAYMQGFEFHSCDTRRINRKEYDESLLDTQY